MTSRAVFARLLRLAAPFKRQMALAVLLGVLTIGSSLGLMAASAWIIATAALQPSVADLAVAIVGVRFFGLSRGVFRYLERLVSHHVNFSILARLRVWFYSVIEPLAPARLMAYRSGDLLSRIVGDLETLQNVFIRVIAPPLVAVIIALLTAMFMAAYAPSLALIVLSFMAILGIGVPLIVQRLSRHSARKLIAVRSDLNTTIVDGLQGAADLIALGREADQATQVNALSRESARWQLRMASITGLHTAAGTLLVNLAMWCVLIAAIPLVRAAKLSGVDLTVLALATLASFEGVLALPLAFQYLEASLAAARRLFEIAEIPSPPNPLSRSQTADFERGGGGELIVRDLSFRYASHEPLALDRVSFDLKPGQVIAIIGPSGAGKSSLVNVLLRFWEYEAGSIMLDGIEVRDLDPEVVRAQFGVVPQATHLFNTTIRENLRLARSDASDAELIAAAQIAQLHDFIATLPQDYDTSIGEQGLRLSGGERQRLAIARAVLKRAPILIFDEATANLDAEHEREVVRAIQAASAQHAVLMITHRLIGLETADEIIVLNGGRVIERGRHAELLQIDGAYRRMWQLQHQVNERMM